MGKPILSENYNLPMRIDPTDIRRRYEGMSDEELLSLDSEELSDIARPIYQQEIAARGLDGDPAPLAEETEAVREDAEPAPDWADDAAVICTFAVDPSTNPYLAAAMFLGAGLDGIEQDLDPGDPQLVNMYELSDQELEKRGIRQLPRTLLEAVTAFEADDLGRRVMGDELYRSYIDLKKSEWWSYHNSISQWEIDEYLTKF